MKKGCITALITPFTQNGELDKKGLEQLIEFQIQNDITGILVTGTTGESPTFKWQEHNHVIALAAGQINSRCLVIAGTGSNNTDEALMAAGHAAKEGVDAILMVDPYYNGPSSLEIRKEYYEAVAARYPDLEIIPYIIPGRTGAQMLPQDLALLAQSCPNITCVKEATGNLDNMKLTRQCCGPEFKIFSGDDALVYEIMTDPDILACGSISVMSNIVPGFMAQMVSLINHGDINEARQLQSALKPLLDLVVVTTTEQTPFGPVTCRARNPLPLKTVMQLLGMPSGPCRRPLGKMTRQGLDKIVTALQTVHADHPELLTPVAEFFNIDLDDRLHNPIHREGLCYGYE
ncbi:MAG: 4-hydroxy-tetrahydrodipicolinate synthase [Desulfotignum sp.]|nr:4-hydroxy-tetrahydrodipicolinate synthase [Desulfotignum sp.]MCF8112854.1 4-hydroxy-tetrahydrodipicolinate synthase [Desulfotignum sp.]MCF8125178.1 4-hydroxy-tetrahydrodipicolinate synthase [Desulfotignum sp.]